MAFREQAVTRMSNRHLIHVCLAGMLAMGTLSAAPAHAGIFGESDEEKAARQQAEQRENNQDAAIASLNQRVQDLEESLRRSTGQNEALTHTIQELDAKIDRQKKDFEYRLCQLAAQQLGAAPTADGDQTALPCDQNRASSAAIANFQANNMPVQSPPPSSGIVHLAPPPGVLGTLPASKVASLGAPPAASNPQTRAQFDSALNLLAKARYDEARASFRSFADANPTDDLASQAIYWIGDIDFVQKDYTGAAHAFAEQIKKYPTSTRGPDSMLKLGQSLIALGQTKEGCMTLGALSSKYPTASKTVVAQAASERKASCH